MKCTFCKSEDMWYLGQMNWTRWYRCRQCHGDKSLTFEPLPCKTPNCSGLMVITEETDSDKDFDYQCEVCKSTFFI